MIGAAFLVGLGLLFERTENVLLCAGVYAAVTGVFDLFHELMWWERIASVALSFGWAALLFVLMKRWPRWWPERLVLLVLFASLSVILSSWAR